MANKRVETGRGRKPGVVKASKKPSTSNRAFYLIIAVIAVGGIAALTYASTRSNAVVNASPVDTTLPAVKSEGYVMGSPTAPVEVIEFGDFECPQCGRFATLTEPDIRKNLVGTGMIRFRYIDFPLQMHPNTWNASRAAACADQQGKFWEMHDALYANQDRWDGTATRNPDKVLRQIGDQIVPDKSKFDTCVDTKATQAKIQAHWSLGVARHVEGTPTLVIGDKQVAQSLPYDRFKQLVDSALAKSGKTPAAAGGDTAQSATVGGAKGGSKKAR
jgi:protein-disulfide isomerase